MSNSGTRKTFLQAATLLLAVAMTEAFVHRAAALIEGDVGNKPVTDPGWPQGAAAIFNHTGRIAYWVGPGFGGGQWTGEYRGNAKEFSGVLDSFSKLDVKNKRVVVHDGAGQSFWLNMN